MKLPKETKLLNTLLQQEPEEVLAWIHSVFNEQVKVQKGFNWLGLAEMSHQFSQKANPPNLEWAKIAVKVYEFLGDDSSLNSAMGLRVYLIKACGIISEDQLLDPKVIVNWFFSGLDMAAEEALEKSENWQEKYNQNHLGIHEVAALRRIKIRIRRIKDLVESNLLNPTPIIEKWLAVEHKLP